MKMKKVVMLLSLTVLCAGLCVSCKKKNEPEEAVEQSVAEDIESETEEADSGLSEEVQALVDAIEKTSKLSAFQMTSDIQLNLNGKLIQLSANIHSETEIIQGKDRKNLQMKGVTTSDQDDVTAYAYYKDGIYYTDDQNGKNKEEKSPDEVMQTVTDITGMVIDAADEIQNLTIAEEGDATVYTYDVPPYLAENYLEQLAQSQIAEDTELKGAKADVEYMHMVSTVGKKGMLVKQEGTIAGDIKKSIFKVPADASITATFEKSDKTTLEIPTW